MKTELPPLPPIDGVLGYTRAQMIDYASKAVKLSHTAPAAEEAPQQDSWANVPQEFRDWWNADYDDSTNPFRLNSSAYWAWAGWNAAKQQPATHGEPVAWRVEFHDGSTETTTRTVPDWKRLMWESAGKRWKTIPLYTSPQPTPSHIKAMQQALVALNGYRRVVTKHAGLTYAMGDKAIAALQNAMKNK